MARKRPKRLKNHFITVFQQRALPDEIEEVDSCIAELENGQIRLDETADALGLQPSGSEAKRSIQQGAVRINTNKIDDPLAAVIPENGDIIQVGKRKFVKLIIQ